jgi:hypothetical protein
MDKSKVKEFLNEYLDAQQKLLNKFVGEKLIVLENFSSEEVFELLKDSHNEVINEPVKLDSLKFDEGYDQYIGLTDKKEKYVIEEKGDEPKIVDILMVCECVLNEMDEKCGYCEGSGKLDGEECPACEGSGDCPMCGGEGNLTLSEVMEHVHAHGPEKEPVSKREEILEGFELEEDVDEKALMSLSSFLFEFDKIFYSYYLSSQKIYDKYFSKDDLEYPSPIYPNYMRSEIQDLFKEGNTYFANVFFMSEAMGLVLHKVDDEYKIIEMNALCPLFQDDPESHADVLECNCNEVSDNGKPEEDCDQCYGTGKIICPVCLGVNFIPIAPDPLNHEDLQNKNRYIEGVRLMLEAEEEMDDE